MKRHANSNAENPCLRLALILGFMVFCCACSFAQGVKVAGMVMDVETNAGIPSAAIELSDSKKTIPGKSNEYGMFDFSGIAFGKYKLTIKHPGFQEYVREINIPDEATAARDFSFMIIQLSKLGSKVRGGYVDYTEYDKLHMSIAFSKDKAKVIEKLLAFVDAHFKPTDEEYFYSNYIAAVNYGMIGYIKEGIICYNKAIEAYETNFPFTTRYASPMVTRQLADYVYFGLASTYFTAKLYETTYRYMENHKAVFLESPYKQLRQTYYMYMAIAGSLLGYESQAIENANNLKAMLDSKERVTDPVEPTEIKIDSSYTQEVREQLLKTQREINETTRKMNERTEALGRLSLYMQYHSVMSTIYLVKFDYEKALPYQLDMLEDQKKMKVITDEMTKEGASATSSSALPDSTKRMMEAGTRFSALPQGNAMQVILSLCKTRKCPDAAKQVIDELDRGMFNTLSGNHAEAEKNYQSYFRLLDGFKNDNIYNGIAQTMRYYRSPYYLKLLALEGKYEQALAEAGNVVKHDEAIFKNGFSYFTENEKKELFNEYNKMLDLYYSLLLSASEKDKTKVSELINKILQTKGIILEYTKSQNARLKRVKDPQVKALIERIRLLRQKQASFNQLSSSEGKPQWRDSLLLNGKRINDLERSLNEKTGVVDDFFKPVQWQDVKKKLKQGEVYLDIARIARDNFQYDAPKIQYWAFVIKPNSTEPEYFLLGEGETFESRGLRNYQNRIRSVLEDMDSYPLYWKKIGTALEGSTRAYVSSDGVYQLINPLTLQNPDTKKYVLDEIDIVRLSSGRDLGTSAGGPAGVKSLTLVANPDFTMSRKGSEHKPEQKEVEPDQIPVGGSRSGFLSLPGTEKESELIESNAAKKGLQVSSLEGKKATEESIKSMKPTSVIHFATHGVFDDIQDKSDSYLKSKLVLAGAADPEPFSFSDYQRYEDGFLTGYEVTQMDLNGTSLVVMSACETGLGDVQSGEGVWGLQRAFQLSGAKAVIGSLWKISDETTVFFMESFYKALFDNQSFQDSYKKAMEATRSKYPHPYHWGAFVLLSN